MSCVFCAIIAGNAPGHILWQDADTVVILSLEGHPLVLPRRHAAGLDGLYEPTAAALMVAATRTARAVRAETGCDGISLVLSDGAAAGQDVFHLHMHVKPRWDGDDVVLRWDTTRAPEGRRAQLAGALAARLDGARRHATRTGDDAR